MLPWLFAGITAFATAEVAAQRTHPEHPAAPASALRAAPIAPDALVDGWPSDAAWQQAAVVDRFRQVSPTPGATPTRRTELSLLQDGRRLYVRVVAFEPAPAGIVAQQMRRDTEALPSDDHVTLVIDVEGAGRNGFLFLVSPQGTQYDSLIYDGGYERHDWDALWASEARIESDRWTALLAIPFSALGVAAGTMDERVDAPAQGDGDHDLATAGQQPVWRINAERWIAAGSERVRLAGQRPDKEIFSLGETLPMVPVMPDQQGWGLRLKAAVRLTAESASASPTGEARRRLEPSLELFHQSVGGLRTTAALNTDFGEAEADERVINLSRFELFLPEKREFFLRDAGRFSFGGLSESSAIPYYSRRIGLDGEGRARGLDAGLKFTGSAAGLDFGLFGARVAGGATAPGEPDQRAADVAVARVSKSLSERHRIGAIATRGNPQGTSGSGLWGLDHQFRDTAWRGDKTLETHAWLQQSTNTGLGTGRAWGGSVRYPNVGLTGNIALQRVERNFEPALGYLAEAGVTRGEGEIGWWHRTEQGGDVTPGIDWNFRRTLDGRESSTLINPELWMSTAAGDAILPEVFFETDHVATGYAPVPGLFIRPGTYQWNYLFLLAETSPSRPVSGYAELRSGGYYNGHRNDQAMTVKWNPNPNWGLELGGARNAISLPDGRFTVRTATLRLDHTPTTRLSQSLLLQWDNISSELGVSARVRWLWGPGRELLFSLDRLGYTGDQRDLLPNQTRAMLKLVWNLER